VNSPDSEVKKASRLKEIIAVLKANDIIHGTTPEKFRKILEELGPTFIKLGQMMSLRPDILPQRYCDELRNLRANVRPMDFREVERVLAEAYGSAYREFFREIDPIPLGSASIAQVHQAVLQNGCKVVLKVQRLEIREIMAEDIAIIRKAIGLMKMLGGTGEALDFKTIIDEMWAVAQQELDFLTEAAHFEEFARLNSQVKYIACPQVQKDLTTTNILVMEHIDGVPIDDLEALREMGYDLNEIGGKLAENYAKQVLDDAFFHADPHPGNIRIRDGKIVWLDLGMMGRLSNRDRQLLKSAVNAIVKNDTYELKNVLLTLGTVKGKINHTGLYTDIDDMLTKYRQLDLSGIDLGMFFKELSAIANRYNIAVPKGVAMLGRGVVTLEGVLVSICPELNFVQIMADHMFRMMLEDFNATRELKQVVNRLVNSLNKSIDIPAQLTEVLRIAAKGQAKLNLEVIGADEPLGAINKMVNKLVIGLIDAAFLIGSSIICVTGMEPKILGIPILGVLGYFAATVLGMWLLYGIIFQSRK
jgi:ubiquinone biosynthesis protein